MERMCINQRYIHSLHLFRVFASAQSQGRECAVAGPRVRSHRAESAQSQNRECAVTPAHTLFALVSTQR